MDARTLLITPEDIAGHSVGALLLLLPCAESGWHLAPALDLLVRDVIEQGDLELKAGRTVSLFRPVGLKALRLLIAVVDSQDGLPSPAAVRRATAALMPALKACQAPQATLLWGGSGELDGACAEAAFTTASDALYTYRHTKPSAPAAAALKKLQFACSKVSAPEVKEGLRRAAGIAAGVELARECANRPGNHCTPTHLAEQALELARSGPVDVEVLDRKAVEKLGMGAFLSVARGSDEPLQFIVLRYQGAGKKDAPVVLVGKGVTFDTGGISIKPAAEMDEMKFDMGGAASVLGTFKAIAELKPKVNLIGLIPACENMPSGRATKPGDVITSMSGQTIEVLNTDAEGRLILCDALTYAERFKPAAVVDIATLTGACVIALGHHRSGLFSADDVLAGELLDAGTNALDPAWRMPLDEEYGEALKSNFADMGNVGPRAGGSISAAMFLKRYTSAYPWAHLDIAGTAWKSGAQKGATGRPVPLLTHFVLGRSR
ncbi:aminopeptidase A [Sphaerotilus hippei]|uniref:Probable cytosol aminopeptidase n=1 Tax=Sphaerotilus hippei TaxID=744406 RepID=A0A318H946_9BURK|nr:leucyl aminopeptidase [Sphaerotilus hippei]PXW94747.1 aminopeptidase A [Sphaerotilus hippei]